MERYYLAVEPREDRGTSSARRLRHNDQVPAIIYGPEKENTTITVNAQALHKAMVSHSSLIDLALEDKSENKRTVVIKDVQLHPLRGDVLHVDFYEVDMNRPIRSMIPVSVVGEEEREEDHGLINRILREIEISSLPGAIPEYLEVDISALTIGDSFLVSDLVPPEGVEVITPGEEAILSIVEAREYEEEVEAEEGEEGDEEVEGEGAEEAGEEDPDEA